MSYAGFTRLTAIGNQRGNGAIDCKLEGACDESLWARNVEIKPPEETMLGRFFMKSSCKTARLSVTLLAGFLAASGLLGGPPLQADDYYWLPSLGDWSDPNNWLDPSNSGNPGTTVPSSSDTAYIANGGIVIITLPNAVCGGLAVSNGVVQVVGGNLSATWVGVNSGSLQINGGNLVTTSESIGGAGGAFCAQSGGENNINGSFFGVGWSPGDNGTYNLSGAASLNVAQTAYVGMAGTGSFTQSAGTTNANSLVVGDNSGGSGVYIITGGVLNAGWEMLGNGGTGTLTQSGGINNTSGLSLGGWSGANGTYNLNGGVLNNTTNSESVGEYGTGTFTQSGGTNNAGGLAIGGWNSGGGGTYTLNGGLLILSSLSQGAGSAVFNFNAGTLQASGGFSTSMPMTLGTSGGGATFDTAGNSLTLAGSLSGSGGLTLNDSLGTGALTLVGSNSYSGPTTINGGVLQLSNSAALGNSSGVTVAAGASLALQGGIAIPAIPLTISGTGTSNSPVLSTASAATIPMRGQSSSVLVARQSVRLLPETPLRSRAESTTPAIL